MKIAVEIPLVEVVDAQPSSTQAALPIKTVKNTTHCCKTKNCNACLCALAVAPVAEVACSLTGLHAGAAIASVVEGSKLTGWIAGTTVGVVAGCVTSVGIGCHVAKSKTLCKSRPGLPTHTRLLIGLSSAALALSGLGLFIYRMATSSEKPAVSP